MITRFFGLPGCGKTTVAAKIAYEALRSGKFRNVYGNVPIAAPGYTYIPFSYVGQYLLEDCCIIIDEAAIECGNRDFKNFSKERVEFFMTHRHYRATVVLFSQEPDGVDTKIRAITDRMFYIKKGNILGHWVSTIYRIPYGLVWPDENSNGENLGKIVMGYLKPSLLSRLFAQRIYRPRYYHLFDSWETKSLPPIPQDKIKTIPGSIAPDRWVLAYWHKTSILLRSHKALKKRLRRLRRAEKRRIRNKEDNKALERSSSPTGINCLSEGVRIHA